MNEIKEIVLSFNEYIKKIPNGAKFIADNLREENFNDALFAIKDFSEGLLWLSEVQELLKLNNVSSNLNVNQLHEFLNEVNSGLEIQDFVIVADMFEYEIAPYFEEVNSIEYMEQ